MCHLPSDSEKRNGGVRRKGEEGEGRGRREKEGEE